MNKEISISIQDATHKEFSFTRLQQLHDFLETEINFWIEQEKKFENLRRSRPHPYIGCVSRLREIKKRMEALQDPPPSDDAQLEQHIHFLQHQLLQPLRHEWLWSKHSYVQAYVECNIRHGDQSADAFIRYILHDEVTQISNKQSFLGIMLAYGSLYPDQGIGGRYQGEKHSFDALRDQYQNNINKLNEQSEDLVSRIKEWEAKTQERVDALYESIKSRGDQEIQEQSENFTQTSESQSKEFDRRIEHYTNQLRWAKPANRWNETAKKRKRQGNGWMVLLVLWAILGLGVLGYLFDEWLRGVKFDIGLDSMQGAVIFAAIMLIYAFVIRGLSRLAFSSFHLMRDAEEREQLTYLYLSLSEDNPSEKESRDIILQALFSRSQTGLLVDEHGPTMPLDLLRPTKTN